MRRRRPRLFLDAQHGLCNRLRALASGAVIAHNTGRELVTVWHRDEHCRATLHDLLAYDGPVIDGEAGALMRARAARVYNYMEIEPGSQFREVLNARDWPDDGDVYVRSAYTLHSPHRTVQAENRFLRALRPSPEVRALVARVDHPVDVAAHIRMGTGPEFDHLPYEAPDNWPESRHAELVAWRQKSDVSRFIARLDRMLVIKPDLSVFVAADLAATYAALHQRYGARVRFLRRERFDRSAQQMQYALADLILLTAAPHFLASEWSSFSEVAQRLARPWRTLERSGIDF
ncbi:O-fucosyltransferase family protein [Pararhodobacter zhoushanensis]|uniref:Uncharacterized protein n=1 Tax=Pararhodobacter zhoushanensis TaxID=2479545 RepID=A0ABT3H266_9RHOB|nr:hypothetical protein [Pararhodobacter zhoushanensis]MCW1933920.1 hypothetical protein [Pararhodobacter zhoushanensis]